MAAMRSVFSESGDYLRIPNAAGLIVTICVYCHKEIAVSKTTATLKLAETAHDCRGKREYYEGTTG